MILRYSVAPARYPLALLQLAKSVAYLREHAEEFHIDTAKIILQGFSAGAIWLQVLGYSGRKIYLRSIAYRNRNSETERHDPQLSGHFLREICTYGVF